MKNVGFSSNVWLLEVIGIFTCHVNGPDPATKETLAHAWSPEPKKRLLKYYCMLIEFGDPEGDMPFSKNMIWEITMRRSFVGETIGYPYIYVTSCYITSRHSTWLKVEIHSWKPVQGAGMYVWSNQAIGKRYQLLVVKKSLHFWVIYPCWCINNVQLYYIYI